jgi:quercetin dioxygenase-like cupin family protein
MTTAKGIIMSPGAGQLLALAPGRSSLLKLLSGETDGNIMMFVETAPPETTFHLHRDSDEIAYVLEGEITFKIGDEVTVGGPGSCAFLPKGLPHAWKNTGRETGKVLFLYTPASAGKFFEAQVDKPLAGPANGPEANALREQAGWEVVGPPPF